MQYGPKIATNGLVLALDAADMNSYSPNVHPNPTDIYAWAINGGSTSCTITRDSSQTRQYGSKPMKMAVTGNDPYIITINYGPGASSIWNLAPAVNGQTWTISVYVKASVATTGELFLMPADSNGVVITSASGAINITTSWTRVSFTYTISSANCAYIQCRLDGPNTGGSGIDIWWDGLQVERASSATQFNPYYYGNTVWRDFSRNNNNGTLINGPIFSNTNYGSIVFDGTNDYVNCGNLGSFYAQGTISYWMYSTAVENYRNPFSTTYLGGNVGIRFEQYTTVSPYGGFNVLIGNDAGTYSSYDYSPTSVLNANTWYNVVLVWNTSTNKVTGYLNSILKFDASHTYWATTLPSISIGSGFDSGRYFKGNIANTLIYNRALIATEVLQNYRATKGRFGL